MTTDDNDFVVSDGMHPADIADALWQDVDIDRGRQLFSNLGVEEGALVLAEADEKLQVGLLEERSPEEISQYLNHLSIDDGVDLLNLLPETQRLETLCFVDSEVATELRHLISYPAESAGGMMTTEFLSVAEDALVGDVFKLIKGDEGEAESVYVVYVVNQNGVLEGVISTRELLELSPDDSVGEFMNPDVISASVEEDREDVARRILRYNLSILPIVDARNSIIGVVSTDDALEVVEEEGSEDALLLAGASGDSDAGEPLFTMVAHRAPYLTIPVIAGLIMSKVMDFFTQNTAVDPETGFGLIVSFVPMVLALSGTVGMQTSAVLVRGFAVGQIVRGRRLQVFMSELRVGVVLGLMSALVATPAIGLLIGDFFLATFLGVALWLAVVWTSTAATTIVVGAESFGLDPALVAGPIMIAVSDLSAVALFLGVASAIV
ncbi:MAG: magnesium transporter [Planctomycetota bacterium]|jgi:magnesium transporter|nr:magnesium transporter [Planctomycetota bacterium]